MKFLFTTLFTLLGTYLLAQNKAGTIDESFGNNGIVLTSLQDGNLQSVAAATQKDGKIICGGGGVTSNPPGGFMAARYTPDGVLDTSFGSNGLTIIHFTVGVGTCNAMAIQSDDKIVLTGYGFKGIFNPTYYILTARLNANGSIDSSFGKNGTVITANVGINAYAVSIQTDDKIVISGFNSFSFVTFRLLPDGSMDKNFGTDGVVTTSFGNWASASANVIRPDGKILVGGGNSYESLLARYSPDGSLDNSFGNNGQVETDLTEYNEGITDMILQPDGKILTCGIQTFQSTDTAIIARYMPNGSLDESFGEKGLVKARLDYSSKAFRLKLQDDGKLIVAGYNILDNDAHEHFLVLRFNNNGSVDSSFGDNGHQVTEVSSLYDGATGIVIQNDNKIVLCGSAYDYNAGGYGIALVRYYGDASKKQILIAKIRRWLQHHNGIVWDNMSGAKIYAVQRSGDGVRWTTVHSQQSTGNNQSSIVNAQPSTVNYYNDASPLPGTNYYRLQTTSVNGAVVTSNVIAVTSDVLNVSLSPNPAKNTVSIAGLPANEKVKLTVIDFSGNVKLQGLVSASSYNLDITSLHAGNYVIKMDIEGEVVSKQFVKE